MPRLKLSQRERLINTSKKVADLKSRTEFYGSGPNNPDLISK